MCKSGGRTCANRPPKTKTLRNCSGSSTSKIDYSTRKAPVREQFRPTNRTNESPSAVGFLLLPCDKIQISEVVALHFWASDFANISTGGLIGILGKLWITGASS